MALDMAVNYGVRNQMLLAQEWDTEGTFFGSAKGSIVVDNGSWEGALVDLKHLIAVAERHGADFVVLPDVPGNASVTRTGAVLDAPIVDAEGFKPVAAMQALTMEGLEEDLEVYASLGIKYVGLPSKLMYAKWDGTSRIDVLRDLVLSLEKHRMKVHLLGLMERPNELLEIALDKALNDFVVSVDTASALRWALARRYPSWGTQLHVPRWIWENLTLEDLSESDIWQWKMNRDQLEHWAQGIE
jgi:sugar phosphate isomerase/epimerase